MRTILNIGFAVLLFIGIVPLAALSQSVPCGDSEAIEFVHTVQFEQVLDRIAENPVTGETAHVWINFDTGLTSVVIFPEGSNRGCLVFHNIVPENISTPL